MIRILFERHYYAESGRGIEADVAKGIAKILGQDILVDELCCGKFWDDNIHGPPWMVHSDQIWWDPQECPSNMEEIIAKAYKEDTAGMAIKVYKAGDRIAELKPLNTAGKVVFHAHVPLETRQRMLVNISEPFHLTEVDSLDGEIYPFEFGYADKSNISNVMDQLSRTERMLIWLDIVEADPSYIKTFREVLAHEDEMAL